MKKIIKLIFQFIDMTFYIFINIFIKNKCNVDWLICERGTEARDNGYHLFKYIRENYPTKNVYYLINSDNTKDFDKIKKLGNFIEYGSKEHKIAFLNSKKLISTHIGFISPWSYRLYKKTYYIFNKKKYVFLQHGITKDDLRDSLGPKVGIDLFICGAKAEYEYIKSNFGYKNNEVIYTGFPRYDSLEKLNVKENIILIMPTWRKSIIGNVHDNFKNSENFIKSDYYKTYISLINNENFLNIIEKFNYRVIFYPHYECQKYIDTFYSKSKNVIIANKSNYDIQQLLIVSNVLITDYSSVFFDFAYMKKSIFYYQFDKKDFFETHYKKGYFDYENNGFGPVMESESELISNILKCINNDCKMDKKYEARIDKFFELQDKNNCKRVFESINNL